MVLKISPELVFTNNFALRRKTVLTEVKTFLIFRQYHGDTKRWLHYQPNGESDDSLSAVR
jgi:hypothetical protein